MSAMLIRMTVLAGLLSGCATRGPLGEPAPVMVTAWAHVLGGSVDRSGRIDFRGLAARPAQLDATVASIAATAPNNVPGAFPSRADQIAFDLNAYNALAMSGVVRAGIPDRFSLLGRVVFFKLTRFVIGGAPISLYDYENDVIRPLGEERVHFALNCMAVSCPRLPRIPFDAPGLDRQLDAAARLFFSEPRNVTVDDAGRTVFLSSILDFYTSDFLAKAPSLIAYVNRYRVVPVPADYRVRFFQYDWTVNRQP